MEENAIMSGSSGDAQSFLVELPIAELPLGDVLPPCDPGHVSHRILAPWRDPFSVVGGRRKQAFKSRINDEIGPCIEWSPDRQEECALITGTSQWRECSVSCRVMPLQEKAEPTADGHDLLYATAGIVFRMKTLRCCYYFCVQGRRRLVLFRRQDDQWHELAAAEIAPPQAPLSLHVRTDGDEIHASCPEEGVRFAATDAQIISGPCGFRARGACRLYELHVAETAAQAAVNRQREKDAEAQLAHLSESVPGEQCVASLDLPPDSNILNRDYACQRARNVLLLRTPDALFAWTAEGKELWRAPVQVSYLLASADRLADSVLIALVGPPAGRLNGGAGAGAALPKEVVKIDGATGQILCRAPLPRWPDAEKVAWFTTGVGTGNLSGQGKNEFVLCESRTHAFGSGRRIQAFDDDLRLLWQRAVDPPYGHGNSVRLQDVDGDGRTEVLAGGVLLSGDGEVLWTHDRAGEMPIYEGYTRWPSESGHYDAILVGHFAADDRIDPVAFLISGSAGVYVVDARTGRTRAVHRVGHAQWAEPCSLRDDIPGTQILVGNRWESFGILTLFSGRGERLWSIQPDYLGQGSCPVQWSPTGPQHIWVNTSWEAFGLYDGFGRMVKPLAQMRRLGREQNATPSETCVVRRAPEQPDLLGLKFGRRLYLFGPQTW